MSRSSWKSRWAERLFQIFVSQKLTMFVITEGVAYARNWENLAITGVTIFGGMKVYDYYRTIRQNGGSHGADSQIS